MNSNILQIIKNYDVISVKGDEGEYGGEKIKSANMTPMKFRSIKKDVENIIKTIEWEEPTCDFCFTKTCKPHKKLFVDCRSTRCMGIRFKHKECICKKSKIRPSRTIVNNLHFEYFGPKYIICIKDGYFWSSTVKIVGGHQFVIDVKKHVQTL